MGQAKNRLKAMEACAPRPAAGIPTLLPNPFAPATEPPPAVEATPEAEAFDPPSRTAVIETVRRFEQAKLATEQARLALEEVKPANQEATAMRFVRRNRGPTAAETAMSRLFGERSRKLVAISRDFSREVATLDGWAAGYLDRGTEDAGRSVLQAFAARALEIVLEDMARWDGRSADLVHPSFVHCFLYGRLAGSVDLPERLPVRPPMLPQLLDLLPPEDKDAVLAQDIDGNIVFRGYTADPHQVRTVAFLDLPLADESSRSVAVALRKEGWQAMVPEHLDKLRDFFACHSGRSVWFGHEDAASDLAGIDFHDSHYRRHFLDIVRKSRKI